ncbi:adenylate/guanylate cyclase domain-containing protein [Ferrovibrio sp.]|uniref:adenylate/guanylate cyclase domain-containing protein n=1 Tax=Ferrovibrio sp. TaxID=1917215 RepID=UPI0035B284A5
MENVSGKAPVKGTGHREQTWTWHLPVPPDELWPLLSDTARMNEALGTPRYNVEEIAQPDGSVRRHARADYKGVKVEWDDRPYEWVAGRSFRNMRIFERGPLAYFGIDLLIEPDGDAASKLTYTIHVAPRGLLGRFLILTGLLRKSGAAIETMVRQAADHARGLRPLVFDYQPPAPPPGATERLQALSNELAAGDYAHGLAGRLAETIATAQEVDLIRLRPRRLAEAWHAPLRNVVELCLDATRRGLLTMSWNLLCPRCGGAKTQLATLDKLPRGAHCPSCNIDYERDFTRNVEISFQPAASLRPLSLGEFCMGGPHVSRHICVQQHLAPGETRQVEADLPAGEYRIRALQPGGESIIHHLGGAFPAIMAADDGESFGVTPGAPAPDGQVRMVNESRRMLSLVIESREWRRDALTAHEVTTLQAFRDLLPEQVLHPGEDVGIDHVTLMFTDLEGSTALYERMGDGAAYRMVRRHFAYLAEVVRDYDGALVKTIGDAVMAAFADPAQAVRAALAVQGGIDKLNRKYHIKTAREGKPVTEAVILKMGLHAGRCIAVNLNNRLDYFGSTVNLAARLQGKSRGGEIVLSEALAQDPAVQPLLNDRNARAESAELKGFDQPVPFLRLRAG